MKTSAVAILASVSAVLAKPVLLNSNYNVVAGEPFELKYSGCENGCTITLDNGPSGKLKPFLTLTAEASGDSFTFTLDEDIPTDTYAIRIVDNSDNSRNFSPQFDVEGSGAPPASSTPVSTPPASTPASTSAVETTSSEAETTSSEATSSTTLTSVVTSTSAVTPTPQTTSSNRATTSSSDEETSSTSTAASTSTTSIADSGATGVQAQLGLILAAAAAVAYL